MSAHPIVFESTHLAEWDALEELCSWDSSLMLNLFRVWR